MTAPVSASPDKAPEVTSPHPGMSVAEFVALTAGLMALNALAIDVMLPAMSEIGAALSVAQANDVQQIVVVYMWGFGISQLVIGPLSDRFGRKRVLAMSLFAYVAFALACTLSASFAGLLAWRFLLGMAAGGTRVITISIVRDLYAGRAMARIMSLVMTVFMVVPILAPGIGQIVLFFAPWQGTFAILAIGGLVMMVWSLFRLPETRPPEDCTSIEPRAIFSAYGRVLTNRVSFGYMLGSGVIFGALFGFIAAAEQIFTEVFDAETSFVIWFALVAAALSAANFTNAGLVERFGMRRISHLAIIGFTASSVVLYLAMTLFEPNLFVFVGLFAVVFAFFGFIGPNFNALAMEPHGQIAGTASAVLGFASTTLAASIGGLIGRQFNGTADPILLGYVGLGLVTFVIILATERGRLFSTR